MIDSAIDHHQSLAARVIEGATVKLLDSDRDGIAQITTVLQATPHITQLHLVTQRTPNHLQLGSTSLKLENLARYSHHLQNWFVHTLCLYSGNLAREGGTELLEKIQQLTGATLFIADLPDSLSSSGKVQAIYPTTSFVPTAFNPFLPIPATLLNVSPITTIGTARSAVA